MRVYDVSVTVRNQKRELAAYMDIALSKMAENLSLSSGSRISFPDPGNNDSTVDFQIPTEVGGSYLDAEQNIFWGDGVVATKRLTYGIVSGELILAGTAGGGWNKVDMVVIPKSIGGDNSSAVVTFDFPLDKKSITIDLAVTKVAQKGFIPEISLRKSITVAFKN